MQTTRRLSWKLLPSYVGISLVALVAMGWYAAATLTEATHRETFASLDSQAYLVARLLGERISLDKAAEISHVLNQLYEKNPTRLSVLLPSGHVVAESRINVFRKGDLLARPEIAEARAGRKGMDRRFSIGKGEEVLFVAIPVVVKGTSKGIVRASLPVKSFSSNVFAVWKQSTRLCIGILVLSGLLAWYVARRINQPISQLAEGASRLASGDLDQKLDMPAWTEFGVLVDAMNATASRLHDRINTVIHQRNELQVVLAGMVEAVLVLDSDERIARMNRAAEKLFRTSETRAQGRAFQEVIRNTELHEFVSTAFDGSEPAEADITMSGEPERFLQAHGANLKDEQGRITGALVVLNDVTRLKTLEKIRRDFVANVSHELKTPVTSIKGFLETLKEGAISDPVHAERFLDIIIAQTDRLDVIIEDLLTLSRVEQNAEKGDIVLREASIKEVVRMVVKACRFKAEEKNITLQCAGEQDFIVLVNATLLEQAIMNLVDNAIKYSEPGKTVQVAVSRENDELAIQVIDQGCGVPKEHLNRIFERFYRVDKARSRKIGGTGLGLSIVKHIAHAHAGRVSVESSPGRGSTFTIHIPARENI